MTPAPEKAAPIPALLPCPFCGALEDRLLCSVEGEGDYFNVGCEECDCRTAWFDSRAAAYTAWNRRADREARPSLPDSREERIREDEPGYLVRIAFREGRSGGLRITSPDVPGLILSHHDEPAILADMIEVLREADRARARQGGNNG